MCLAQGPQRSDARGLLPAAPRSQVKHSTTEVPPILKTLGQFENLVFVFMSNRENITLWLEFLNIEHKQVTKIYFNR